jgi:hypothetical protein
VNTYYLRIVSHLEQGITENLNLNWLLTNYMSSILLLIKFLSHFIFYGCVKNRNKELHSLYSSPSRMIKSRRMRWAGNVAQMGEKRNAYRILVGIPRRRWADNIKMDLREIGWDGMVWIGLIWLRIGTSGGLL